MAFDPENPKDAQRLAQSVQWSYRRLEPYRRNAIEAIRQYVGGNYSDDGTPDRVPLNMVEMAANIYATQLASNVPRVLVNPNNPSLSRPAFDLELALNHLLKEIRLGSTLWKLVTDALFSPLGIAKVGLGNAGEIEVDGVFHDVGQPFCDLISFDDFVLDMTAPNIEACQYLGNRFTLPLEELKDNPNFNQKAVDRLEAGNLSDYTPAGDDTYQSVGSSNTAAYQEGAFIPQVELLDLWIPRYEVVVTIPWRQHYEGGASAEPVHVVEWSGPESGPYKLLGFNDVPGNLLPLSPASTWMDLHELINAIYRKLGRQAERQKDLLGYQGPQKDDAERVKNASDGEMIQMDNAQAAQLMKFGGIDQANLAFGVHLKDLFTYMAGNLDMLGGLSPQSDTLGQDKLLSENASKRLASMQRKTVAVASEIVESLAWYLWTDPLIELPLVKRIDGMDDVHIDAMFTPESREGDFLDYNFTIEPYSMTHKSPGDRLAALQRFFQNFVVPFVEPMAQQGITIDFEALLRTVAKYEDMKELDDILVFSSLPMEGSGDPHDAKRPPIVHTQNERINRPGGTRSNKDNALMKTLLGGGASGSQMESALGPNR